MRSAWLPTAGRLIMDEDAGGPALDLNQGWTDLQSVALPLRHGAMSFLLSGSVNIRLRVPKETPPERGWMLGEIETNAGEIDLIGLLLRVFTETVVQRTRQDRIILESILRHWQGLQRLRLYDLSSLAVLIGHGQSPDLAPVDRNASFESTGSPHIS